MFKPGKTIRKFKARNGQEIILRYPKMGDVEGLLKFDNNLYLEKDIKTVALKTTRKEKIFWLRKFIETSKKKDKILFLAEHNGNIIGSSELRIGRYKSAHVATFGIAISKEYRNLGIGSELMKTVFHEAKRLEMKIIILQVFSNNNPAIKLYRNIGFKTFGKLPKGIFKNGKYADEIYMYKNI